MSWDVTLLDDRGHIEGDWNYTHNCSVMIYAVLREQEDGWPEGLSWWKHLDGMSGPDGARFLDKIVKGLEADPARFEAMNPENGWGDYRSLVKVLGEIRDRLPEWPCRWSASG